MALLPKRCLSLTCWRWSHNSSISLPNTVIPHRRFQTTTYLLKGGKPAPKKIDEDDMDLSEIAAMEDDEVDTKKESSDQLEQLGETRAQILKKFPEGVYKERNGIFTKGVTQLKTKEIPPELGPGDAYDADLYNYAVLGGEAYEIPKVTHAEKEKMFATIRKRREREAFKNPPKKSTSPYAGVDRLYGSIILERFATLTRDKEQWEVEYENFRHARDKEISIEPYLWGGMRQYILEQYNKGAGGTSAAGGGGGAAAGSRKDRKKKERQEKEKEKEKKSESKEAQDTGDVPVKVAEDEILTPETIRHLKQEKEWLEFYENWQPSPRLTQDDNDNNRKSLNRALARSLYLIVKKDRKEHAWQFPQGGWQRGETMRGTVERELKQAGDNIKPYFCSNAPVGFYRYELPKEAQEKYKAEAAKVFFYRARVMDGDVQLNKKGVVDYLWVTAPELKEYFSPEYYARVRPLLEEEPYIAELKDF